MDVGDRGGMKSAFDEESGDSGQNRRGGGGVQNCCTLYNTWVCLQQERLARERMIEEQDRAFKESLEADRKKVC